jgi:hypothetical protein
VSHRLPLSLTCLYMARHCILNQSCWCLVLHAEHIQNIMMGAVSACPIAERKPVYVRSAKLLAALATQPLCMSHFWATDDGARAAAAAVGELIHQVLHAPVDTGDALHVRRAARFVTTVEHGPEFYKMYKVLSDREESVAREPEPEPEPEPVPQEPQGVLHVEHQAAEGIREASTVANPLSFAAVDDEV